MSGDTERYTCARCEREFPHTAVHTEIARRDFVDTPRPARVERLCRDCLETYVEDFLDREFEAVRDDAPT